MRTCNRCKETKPFGQFYVSKRRRSGHITYDPACKTCSSKRIAIRKRKTEGEYRTQGEVSAEHRRSEEETRANRAAAAEALKIERNSEEYKWKVALSMAYSTESNLVKQRAKMNADPWMKHFHAVVRGMEQRMKIRALIRPKPQKRVPLPTTWPEAIKRALAVAKGKARRRAKHAANPWLKTMETKARNWSRKSNAKRLEQKTLKN